MLAEASISPGLEMELAGERAFREIQTVREQLVKDPAFQEAAARTALEPHTPKIDDPVKPIIYTDAEGITREVEYRLSIGHTEGGYLVSEALRIRRINKSGMGSSLNLDTHYFEADLGRKFLSGNVWVVLDGKNYLSNNAVDKFQEGFPEYNPNPTS